MKYFVFLILSINSLSFSETLKNQDQMLDMAVAYSNQFTTFKDFLDDLSRLKLLGPVEKQGIEDYFTSKNIPLHTILTKCYRKDEKIHCGERFIKFVDSDKIQIDRGRYINLKNKATDAVVIETLNALVEKTKPRKTVFHLLLEEASAGKLEDDLAFYKSIPQLPGLAFFHIVKFGSTVIQIPGTVLISIPVALLLAVRSLEDEFICEDGKFKRRGQMTLSKWIERFSINHEEYRRSKVWNSGGYKEDAFVGYFESIPSFTETNFDMVKILEHKYVPQEELKKIWGEPVPACNSASLAKVQEHMSKVKSQVEKLIENKIIAMNSEGGATHAQGSVGSGKR